jgi:hypothetical protein
MRFYPDTVNTAALYSKYVFALAATCLSAYSLTHETTVKGDHPGDKVRLTPDGVKYLVWFIVLSLLTLGITVAGDEANKAITKTAEDAAKAAEDAKEKLREGNIDSAMKADLDLKEGPVVDGLAKVKTLEDGLQTNLQQTSTQIQTQAAQSSRNIADIEKAQNDLLLNTTAQARQLQAALAAATDDSTTKIRAAVGQSQQSIESLTVAASQSAIKEVRETAQRTQEMTYPVRFLTFELSIPADVKSVPADPAAAESLYHWSDHLAAMQGGAKSVCPDGPSGMARGLGNTPCSFEFNAIATETATHLFAERLFLGDTFHLVIDAQSPRFGFQIPVEDCNAAHPTAAPDPCLWNSKIYPRLIPKPPRNAGPAKPELNTAIAGSDNGKSQILMPAEDETTRTYLKSNTITWGEIDLQGFRAGICSVATLPENSSRRQDLYQQALDLGKALPTAFEWDVKAMSISTGNFSVHPFVFRKPASPSPLAPPSESIGPEPVCAWWSYEN